MSAEKSILTQSSINNIKTWESQLAENLAAHANASLSKAHGMTYRYLLSPYLDSSGNDVGVYYDSGGDVVGYHQMQVTYNNTLYFVPLNSSMLDGQPAATGVPSTVGSISTTGGSAWVTDFVSAAQQNMEATNNLLLPHTQLSHWEAHTVSSYAVLPQSTVDSAGHTVGRYVLKLVYENQELFIPCDTRMGGPPQPARNISITIDTPNVVIPKKSPNTCDVNIWAYATGTLPITYSWQWSITNTDPWTVFTNGYVNVTGWSPGFDTFVFQNHVNIIYVNPGSRNTASVYIRCAVIQPGIGTFYTNSVQFTATDNTGSWIVYAAHAASPFTGSEMRRLYHLRLWSLKHHPETTSLYMGRTGKKLVSIMGKKGFDFTTLTAEIRRFLKEGLTPEQRYKRFEKMVVRSFAEHWPDCPNKLVQRSIVNRLRP